MDVSASAKTNLADCALLCAVTIFVGVLAFHPYYFGDELQSFFYAQLNGASLWTVFSDLNKYKPRLLFNLIWALGSYYEAPRSVFMMLTVASIGSLASILYLVAKVGLGTGRVTALLAGLVVPGSRFITLAYYDYVAGLIETLSALLFFVAVILVLMPKVFPGISLRLRHAVAVLVCILAVFVHERYLAGTAALGAVVIARSVDLRRRAIDAVAVLSGTLMIALPASLFWIATRFFGALPMTTGTAGMQVSVDFGIIGRALTYCGNTLLGLNTGHRWMVGDLQYAPGLHAVILTGLICLFSLVYIGVFTIWRKQVDWRKVVEIAFIAGAMICVASLPDASRQEGRWMTPVLVLMTFAGLYLGRARLIYIAILTIMNMAYLATGSYQGVFNVVASRSAEAIASPLNRIRPEGTKGIILNAPDNGESWVLGGDNAFGNDITSGRIFSKLNFGSQVLVDPGISPRRDYDFGIYYTGVGADQKPLFTYIGQQRLDALLNPGNIKANLGRLVAGQGTWKEWHWGGEESPGTKSVELRPGLVGTRTLPVAELNHKLIIYRARAITGSAVPMRIQINWADQKGGFLGAFIKVVSVNNAAENFVAVVEAPATAREGTIYANLHDGADGVVELDSIKLIGD
jgi:hypothetical protein